MIDPVGVASGELLDYMQLFLEHHVPATLGLLLVPPADNPLARAVCHSFSFTKDTLSPREAFQWLVQVRKVWTNCSPVGRYIWTYWSLSVVQVGRDVWTN